MALEAGGVAQVNGQSGGSSNGTGRPIPPLTLADLMQALNATEANIRWWEGDGTLPRAERDQDGHLLWDVPSVQAWAKSEAGRKFLARRV
jgi:hypothetical protein